MVKSEIIDKKVEKFAQKRIFQSSLLLILVLIIYEAGLGNAQSSLDDGCLKPGVFFCHGFETGSLGEWSGSNWALTTAEKYVGSASLDMFYPAMPHSGDNGGSGFNFINFPSPLSEFHIRWYEKFSPNWKWSPIATKGWMIGESDETRIFYLENDFWAAGERNGATEEVRGTPFRDFPDNRGTFIWTGTNLGKWVEVEAHIKLNTPGQANGVLQEWINGILVRDYSNVNWGNRANFGYFELTGYWNCMNSDCNQNSAPGQEYYHPDMHRYIDNVVLTAGDVYIGPTSGGNPSTFDFSLSNGGSKIITQGKSATNTITSTLSSGTTQSVSFSATGLPSGATSSFSPASCSPICTTTLTINTINSTLTGNYTINVNGVGGTLTRATNFRLTVNPIITNSCSWDFFPRDIPDGKVTLADILVVVGDFGKTSTNPGFNSRMDFNNNNQIDLFDVLTVVAHFGGCNG